MLERSEKKGMVRVAVFYDGGYLNEVSNYYKFYHQRQSQYRYTGFMNSSAKRSPRRRVLMQPVCIL